MDSASMDSKVFRSALMMLDYRPVAEAQVSS